MDERFESSHCQLEFAVAFAMHYGADYHAEMGQAFSRQVPHILAEKQASELFVRHQLVAPQLAADEFDAVQLGFRFFIEIYESVGLEVLGVD